MSESDTRYPYTYACDFIRGLAGYGDQGAKLSRADASCIRAGIAEALGMKDDELASKLADCYKANEDEILDNKAAAFVAARYAYWRRIEDA